MYRSTYLALALYAGLAALVFVGLLRHLVGRPDVSAAHVTAFAALAEAAALVKPAFGYCYDHRPLWRRRVTPYVTLAGLAALGLLGLLAAVDLAQSPAVFAGLAFALFACAGLVDAAARSRRSPEAMTAITLELEERHQRLKADELFAKFNDSTVDPAARSPRHFSRHFGSYAAARAAARLAGLACGAFFFESLDFARLFKGCALATLLLLLFLGACFRELRVAAAHQKLGESAAPPAFCGLLRDHLETCFTHPHHWAAQTFVLLTCLAPVFALEAQLFRLLAPGRGSPAAARTAAVVYACAAAASFAAVHLLLRAAGERTVRALCLVGCFAAAWTANCLVFAAANLPDLEQQLCLAAVCAAHLAASLATVGLVGSFCAASPQSVGGLAINLVDSLTSASVLGARLLLALENQWSGGVVDSLAFGGFRCCALANLLGSLAVALAFLFKVRV